MVEEINILKNIEDSLIKVKNDIAESKYFGEMFICNSTTYIYLNPKMDFKNGYVIKRHQKVKVLERVNKFYKVVHNGKIGYTYPKSYISEAQILAEEEKERLMAERYRIRASKYAKERELLIAREDSVKQIELKYQGKIRKEEASRQKEIRRIELANIYGIRIANRIIARKVWIGMTTDMALASRDKPKDINRPVNQYGTREQWVYASFYLYFDDGILTSWQD